MLVLHGACARGVRDVQKTKTLTAVAIASAGDVACQVLEQRARNERDEEHPQRQGINLARTARMAIFTSAVTPPVHFWYAFLTRRFPTSPLLRMVADQVRCVRAQRHV